MKLNWKEGRNRFSIYFKFFKNYWPFFYCNRKNGWTYHKWRDPSWMRWNTEISCKSITNNKGKMFWTIHTSVKNVCLQDITNFPNEPINLRLQQKLTGSVFPKTKTGNLPKFCFPFLFAIKAESFTIQLREKIRN